MRLWSRGQEPRFDPIRFVEIVSRLAVGADCVAHGLNDLVEMFTSADSLRDSI